MELFRLLGLIIVNNSEANKNIDDTTEKAEKSEGKMSSAFKKIGAAVAAGLAVDKIKDFGLQCIEMAANVQAMNSQFTQTFGEFEEQASAAIGRVAENSGILETRLQGVGTSIYAFARSSGGEAEESLRMMETALQATADAASYYDRSLEDTAESLQSFLKGNFENDAALGLSCTETTRNAAAMEQFGKKFNNLTEIQKQQTLLKMVTDAQALSGAAGQASREMDGWENVTGNLKETMSQLMATLGSPLLPAAVSVVKKLSSAFTSLNDNIKSVIDGDMTFGEFGNQIVTGLQTAIETGVPQMIQMGADILTRIGEGFSSGYPNFAEKSLELLANFTGKIRENAPKLISAGLNMIVNLGKGLANSLPALITYVPTIVSNIANIINDNAPKVLMAGLELIVTLGKGLLQAIPTLVQNIPKIINAIVNVFMAFQWLNLGKSLMIKFKDGIIAAANAVKSAATSIKDTVINAIKSLPSKLFELAKNAIAKIVEALKNTKTVSETVKALGNVIINGIKTIPSKMLSIGTDIVKGLWNGIGNAKSWIMSKIKGFGQGILDEMKDFFGIKSPSRVMRDEVGEQLALGVAEGINRNAWYVKKSAAELSENTLESAKVYSFAPSGGSGGDSAILQRIVSLLEAIERKDSSIYLNSKEISKAVNKDLGVIY